VRTADACEPFTNRNHLSIIFIIISVQKFFIVLLHSITKGLKLLTEIPDVRFKVLRQFKHIFIDEYQDTNILQYQFSKALSPPELLVLSQEVELETPHEEVSFSVQKSQRPFRGYAVFSTVSTMTSQDENTFERHPIVEPRSLFVVGDVNQVIKVPYSVTVHDRLITVAYSRDIFDYRITLISVHMK
jgi:hypothetical protein